LSVEDSTGPLTVSAVYPPPRHTVKQVQLAAFCSSLGRRFIAGGHYNAKHTDWRSRHITPRGREILRTMEKRDLRIKANETRSVHVTFTTRRDTCPPVHINDVQISQENHVKYLGLHLDCRLTWHTNTFFLNAYSLDSHSPNVRVTRPQVQTLYQQQTPHLQSNTQTHLDI
jgi:hypothetical protein